VKSFINFSIFVLDSDLLISIYFSSIFSN
jgi:hypothetical protein